ncbi:MAG: DUF2793 domain-containing protein [Beijerinckiaceae bacterium]
MPSSTLIQLPLLAAAQAQKHVTHNEAIALLDALVHLSVLTRAATAPPAAPADGDRYIIPASATGPWSGQTGAIAARIDGAWVFVTPRTGWRAWIEDENALAIFNGTGWTRHITEQTGQLGINAAADSTNRLVVSSSASLFNHAGNGHQLKLNKASAGDTVALLYQTAFSGRAEVGLAGDDALHIKVSADGALWHEAIVIDPATGRTGIGTAAPSSTLHVAGTVRVGQYAKAALPSASANGAGALIYVSDESDGPVMAFSDGTAWRRVTDRAIVS